MKNIEILFEDRDVIVVNKPSGLIVHPSSLATGRTDDRSKESTLLDWLIEHCPQVKNITDSYVGFDPDPSLPTINYQLPTKYGLVHRLDRETSGVLIIAKTQEMFTQLKRQFQSRDIKKIYHAFVYGKFKVSEGIIDRPIGKSRKDFRLWSAQRGAKGKLREAITEYKVFQANDEVSYVEVRPKTGRTHQIRVHFKAIHHAIVCDKLYAPKRECVLGFKRLALHASSITFEHIDGSKKSVESPLPSDFQQAKGLLDG